MSDSIRQHLTGPTTHREHHERWLGPIDAWPQSVRQRFDERDKALRARLAPGDELWEWHIDGGFLAESGGLAILREGEVVEHWLTWKS